jgi:hypothetical protein
MMIKMWAREIFWRSLCRLKAENVVESPVCKARSHPDGGRGEERVTYAVRLREDSGTSAPESGKGI